MERAPWTVHLATLALSLVISIQVGLLVMVRGADVGLERMFFAAAAAGWLLWGIFRAKRLAWQWGRYLAFFLGLALLAGTGVALARGQHLAWGLVAVVLGGMAAPLLVVAWALGRPASLAWFDLVCPRCRGPALRGKDFFFRQARCSRCGHVW